MSDAPVFRLNPAIDVRDYAETFRRDGIVQIRDIFEPALAELLEKALKDDTYWRLTYATRSHKSVSLEQRPDRENRSAGACGRDHGAGE